MSVQDYLVQDYLVPIMATAFMVTNLFGAALTISRVQARRMQKISEPSGRPPHGFPNATSFRPTGHRDGISRSTMVAGLGRIEALASNRLAIAAIIAMLAALCATALRFL
jgi:hypothetical protein